METYGKRILHTLLYDIALNRESLQVDPESRLSSDAVDLKDLEHALQSVQRLLHETARTITAKGRLNSSLFNLPVEIFTLIIKGVLVDSDDQGYYGQLTELCMVCKGWADTIHGLPELWTHVDLSSLNELLEVVLPRSRDLPLDITGSLDYLFVVDMIKPEAHRWRSLDVRTDDDHALNNLLERPAPCLKELRLVGPRRSAPPTNVFEGNAPRLEAVAVAGCGLPWRSPIFLDLKKLIISGIEEHAPRVDELLDILTDSPQLNEFEIAFTNIQLDIYASPRRVKLPYLRSLRVKYLYPGAMTAVLNSVDAALSAACVFCIRLWDEQDMALELEGVSKRLVALARSIRNGSSTLTLQMGYDEPYGNWDAELKYEPEGGHLGPLSITVHASLERHVDILNHLAGKIQPYTKTSPPKLRLVDIHRTTFPDEANLLFALHRTFPDVRDIALVDLGYDAMVDALRRLFPHPGSGTYPLFSRLTTLTVNRSSHKDWAVWLHSHRRRTGKRGGVTPLPRNLTLLRLEEGSIDNDGLQALQKLASETLSLCNVRLEGELQRAEEE